MANTILITANWHTGALSQQTISRQYDNNHYVVQFVGYPEASEGNELDYYLLVWMSSAPGEKPDEIAPIQLASDQWFISNVFTQQTQQIKFQMCALNTAGTFEAHSPIFTGFVRNSLEHDGTAQDIDVSTLFDAYREYLNELIIRSGAVVIDSTPTQGSTNAVSSGGVHESLASKIAKPLTSPNGTNGQLLRTKGDGTTEWVDQGLPTDEQTAVAVNSWLNAHPEATTTVVDGSITQAKLHSAVQNEINSKASAINAETNQSELHENVNNAISVDFVGNNLAFSTAKYANAKNIMPKITKEWVGAGVSLIASGNFIVYNGTATSNGPTETKQVTYSTPIPAGQYKWHINLSSALSKNSRFIMWVKYDVENPEWVEVANKWVGASVDNIIDITFENNVKTILLKTGIASGLTYDNFKVWYGLFDASVNIVDTGLSVLESETITYSDSSLSEIRTIDTMQHESTVLYVADTKKYIDEHIPDIIGYWSDNIYALPENFGAVGDGVADDTQAIVACLAYASQNNKDVKGYNKYKITQTIALNSKGSNVYLKEIVYTGSDYAIDIQHSNIAFEFGSITSANGGGICFGNNNQGTTFARQCKITGVTINSYKNCILAKNKTLYCVCDIKLLSSINENCIEFSTREDTYTFAAGEYVFENCKCACPNGYVAKNPNASKMYNFTVEGDCKYGLLNPRDCLCVGWRHAEQTDSIAVRVFNGDLERTNGALIVYDDSVTAGFYGIKFISSLSLPWYAIDMSAIQNYDRIHRDDEDPTSKWHKLAYTGIELGTPVRGCFSSGKYIIGNKVYFIGGHKVFVPEGRWLSSITVAMCDFRLLESQTDADIYAAKDIIPMMGTDFSIDIAHTDIYFNASFGAVGYNDLTVKQHDGNTCTIYDKLGNVLFDGTNLGDGKWSLKCSFDRTSFGRLDITTNWWCYDGTNEIWEITQIP